MIVLSEAFPLKSILHVVSRPDGGGAQKIVRQLNASTNAKGLKSSVVYITNPNNVILKNNELDLGLGSAKSPLCILGIRRLVKEKITDSSHEMIVHAHLTWPFYYVVLATLFLDVRVIYTEHSTNNRRRNVKAFRFIEKFFYSRCRKIVCISEGVQKSLMEWLELKNESKCSVINNGVETYALVNRSNLALGSELELVSIGSLSEHKGFDVVIRALYRIRDKVSSYTIVGEGELYYYLRDLAYECGVGDKVHFAGWQENVEPYLINADIQLVPSLWEGFGLAAVEGMSTGLPVIASNVSGLSEVVGGDTCYSILINDYRAEREWAEKIVEMHQRVCDDYTSISQHAHNRAALFNIDSMVDEYIGLYKNVG